MKQVPDTTADSVAMLLSTDWFLPYWSVIGIDAQQQQSCFQQGCRETVKQFVAGARDYYLISSADDRVAATRTHLQHLARTCLLSEQASSRIDELCLPKEKRHEKQTTAWMFDLVLNELAADPRLDAGTRGVLRDARERYAFDSDALENDCGKSQSQWDAYIRQLTPDLPTTLCDFVITGLVPEALLDFILSQLDRGQKSALLAHYKAAAGKKMGMHESELHTQLPDSWR